MTLPGLLSQRAREQGDQLAVAWRGQELTYAQLEGVTARVAAGLAAQGIKQADVVAMLVPNIRHF